jgi:hypothetical protein
MVGGRELHVHLHVSGGLVLGPAGLRHRIFQSCMLSVLQAFRLGDASLYEMEPGLDSSEVWLHFHSTSRRYDVNEDAGGSATMRCLEARLVMFHRVNWTGLKLAVCDGRKGMTTSTQYNGMPRGPPTRASSGNRRWVWPPGWWSPASLWTPVPP